MPEQDNSIWTQFVQSVRPLRHRTDVAERSMPPCLRVRKAPERTLSYTLDLHGYTVEEAYQCLKLFFLTHMKAESRKIQIITGKGLSKTGKIKNEIMLWMDTPFFREKVSETKWMNDGGVLEVTLKRNKKNGKRKNSSRD